MRSSLRVLLLTAAVVALAASMPGAALADGDPASDVLAAQPVFLPQDSGATPQQQAQLAAVENAAQRSGYQIRVAVIASPSDLGSVGALWRQPQSYAQFLGQELSLVYRGTLLVAMPDGFGLYHAGRPTAAQQAVLGRLMAAGTSGLVASTLAAIMQAAAASGHPLPAVSAMAAHGAGSTPLTTWIALAIGALTIAAAWAASFWAMPPRLGRQRSAAAS